MKSCPVSIMGGVLALASLIGGGSPSIAAPPTGGTIAIQPRTGDGDYDRAMPAFLDAAAAALTARGFTVLDDPAHAASVVELTLTEVDVGTSLVRDPHAASVMVGPGVIVPFSTGRSSVTALRRTTLEFRIRRRSETAAWDGAAVTVRETGTKAGASARVATDLAEAILRGYPGEEKSVIGVP